MKCAIVDLGSNTIRLSLYNTLEKGRFETLFSKKNMAGLAGYIKNGIMTNDGINQACGVLLDFKFLLHQLGIEDMHVFATASLRNIKNTDEALEMIKRRTTLDVDIVSGKEEGILGYYGAMFTTDIQNGLMFDIGGGSTELVTVKKGKVKNSQSLEMGSLNLYSNHVSKIWPKKEEFKAMKQSISDKLDTAELPEETPEILCGIGGTIRALLKISNAYYNKKEDNCVITAKEFKKIVKMLESKNEITKNYVLKICPDRVHTIIPGALIVDGILTRTGSKKVHISKYGVREGYLCKNFINE